MPYNNIINTNLPILSWIILWQYASSKHSAYSRMKEKWCHAFIKLELISSELTNLSCFKDGMYIVEKHMVFLSELALWNLETTLNYIIFLEVFMLHQ
jgi:hypothetical protein